MRVYGNVNSCLYENKETPLAIAFWSGSRPTINFP